MDSGCSLLSLFQKTYSRCSFCACALWPAQPHTLLFPTDSHQRNFEPRMTFPFFLISGEITTLWDTEDCRLPASSCAHQKIHILFSLRALNAVISFSSPSWPLSWIFCLLASTGKKCHSTVSLSVCVSLKRVSLDGGGCKSTPQRGGKPAA